MNMEDKTYNRLREIMRMVEIEDIEILIVNMESESNDAFGCDLKITYRTNLILSGGSLVTFEEWSEDADDEIAYIYNASPEMIMNALYEIEEDWIEQAGIDNAMGIEMK